MRRAALCRRLAATLGLDEPTPPGQQFLKFPG